MLKRVTLAGATGLVALVAPAHAQTRDALPPGLAADGLRPIISVTAVGAQIYECRAGAWAFREPIATLMRDGATVGRHFAGPTWEFADLSAVTGKVAARAEGATAQDIPWLRLDVVQRRGAGVLDGVTTVQRIDTEGGQLAGACAQPGALRAEPYAATYVFLRP